MEIWGYDISKCTLILVTAITLLFISYVDRKLGYWRRRGVPSPTLRNYLTEIRDIFTKPVHVIVLNQYRKYGRIYGTFMGFSPNLSVADPTLIKQILVKDFHVFPNRLKIKLQDPLFDSMLHVLEGEDWKRVRCIISPTFTSSRMRKMAYLVIECAENFQKYCINAAECNEEVDCKKCFSAFSIDVIASAAFGTKIDALHNPKHSFIQTAEKMSGNDSPFFALAIMLFPKLMQFLNMKSFFGEIFEYFKNFAGRVIEDRDRNNTRSNDFLQLMLDAQRGKLKGSEEDLKEVREEDHIQILPNNKTLSKDELFAQCILFLVAGNETTSNTLIFFSYYMALHTEYQQRLIDEIDEIWENNEEINFDVLSKLTYLDAVMCEVSRIQPLAIQLMRTAVEDYKLGDTGITINRGGSVIVPIYAMHHDPEFFPDPEKFDPERFMPENRSAIPPYVYLPFGEGPRNCIGTRFAIMTLKLCVIYMLRAVRIEATDAIKKPLQFYKGKNMIVPKNVFVKMIKRRET